MLLLGMLCVAGCTGACSGGQVARVTPRPISAGSPTVPTVAPGNTPTHPAPTPTQALAAQSTPTGLPEATSAVAPTPAAGIVEIKVGDYYFNPAIVTITVGTTVVWIPVGDLQHTIVAKEPLNAFRNGYTAGLGSPDYEWTFNRPGTIVYHCDYHPGAMDAILYVIDK